MEEAFRAALLAHSGLAALVGTRIDWGLRGAVPSVRLLVVSKVPIQTYGGPIGLTPYRIQADCFGAKYGEAKRVARAVEAAVATLAHHGRLSDIEAGNLIHQLGLEEAGALITKAFQGAFPDASAGGKAKPANKATRGSGRGR